MAIHANRSVIGVTAYATVMCIRIRLVRMRRISRMAGADTRKDRVVGRINMAIGTRGAIVRNPEVGMVEYRPQPGGGHVSSVAAYACCRI